MLYAVAIEADDTHTALTRQVADRLQRSSRDLSTTRQRLLDAGLLRSHRRGEITEAVPGLLDYLTRSIDLEQRLDYLVAELDADRRADNS